MKRTVKAWLWINRDLTVFEYLFKRKRDALMWAKKLQKRGQVLRLIFPHDDGREGRGK